MDNEQFMALLELVGQAGNGGFWLTALYIGKGYFIPIVWAAVWTALITRIYQLIGNYFFISNLMEAAGFSDCDPASFYNRKKLMDRVISNTS